MSGDPERLLSVGSGADPLERELLGSVRHVGPPEGAKDQAWRAIAGQIAVGAAIGTATGSSAAAATKAGGTFTWWALGTKVLATVAAGGLALGGGYLLLRSPESAPVSPALSPRPVVSALREVEPPPSPSPPPEVSVVPTAPAPIDAAPIRRAAELPRADLLRAESALLTEARAQLRSGNAAGAQAALDRLQSQFPKGMLTQEREVLAIEVQHARGNVDAAKRRAGAFVKAYPNSPHSAKLSRFL